jgi:hypothetical protein
MGDDMTLYTYECCYAAWEESHIVTVPDQVADDQKNFDLSNKVFPALTNDGAEIHVRLDGSRYGLHTYGTGDMIVRVV